MEPGLRCALELPSAAIAAAETMTPHHPGKATPTSDTPDVNPLSLPEQRERTFASHRRRFFIGSDAKLAQPHTRLHARRCIHPRHWPVEALWQPAAPGQLHGPVAVPPGLAYTHHPISCGLNDGYRHRVTVAGVDAGHAPLDGRPCQAPSCYFPLRAAATGGMAALSGSFSCTSTPAARSSFISESMVLVFSLGSMTNLQHALVGADLVLVTSVFVNVW